MLNLTLDPVLLQASLRADSGLMRRLKGFAAGTPGFGPAEGKSAALALAKAVERSAAPAGRAVAVALLEGARQV